MRFASEQELAAQLKSWNEDYDCYTSSLWAFSITNVRILANSSKEDLQQALAAAANEPVSFKHQAHAADIIKCATAAAEAGGSAVAKSAPPSTHTVMGLMEEAPPKLSFWSTSSSSHTPSMSTPEHFDLSQWDHVDRQVLGKMEWLSRQPYADNRVNCPLGDDSTDCWAEETSNIAFHVHVMRPVNIALGVLGIKARFTLGSKKQQFGMTPDMVFREPGPGGVLRAAGEGKQPKVLKTVQDIVQSWGEGDAQVVSQVVPQMYGYTCGQGVRYGWITTYDRLWVVCMDDELKMRVSKAFPWDSQAPSVRQVLLWLALLANQPEYKMPAQGLSYKPVAVGGSGGGQGSGTLSPASSSRPPMRPPGGQAPSGSAAPHQGAPGHTSRAVAEFGELKAIGSGESGTVYAGRLDGCDVAVKFADRCNSKDIVRHMENEVAVYQELQGLQGNCIPRLATFGYTAHDLVFFVATHLVRGCHPEEGCAVPKAQRDAAERALTAIHEAKYLHGDVRRENLIFEEGTGKAVFLDLGFSRASCDPDEFQREVEQLRALMLSSPTSAPSSP